MQIIVNLESANQLDLIKSLLLQNGFTSFFVEDENEEDDLEDAYLLKLANERRNEPMISAETLLYNLKKAGKLD